MVKKIKILLIQPPQGISKNNIKKPSYNGAPLGLAYIATVLENEGYYVRILDGYSLATSKEKLVDILENGDFNLVGINAMTNSIHDAYEVAKISKIAVPNIKTVVGGPHATALPQDVIKNEFIDFVIYGEGEYTMLELANSLSTPKKINNILGLVYKNKNSQTIINKPRPFIQNLDSLPIPAYHLLPIKQYKPRFYWGVKGNWMSIVTGRGCPFACVFCDVSRSQGLKHRSLSAEKIVQQIDYLYHKFNIRYLSFDDTAFTFQKDKILKVCEHILKNKLNIRWYCNSRVDTLPDESLLELMKKAGCHHIFLGVESGNPKILKETKNVTIAQVLEAIKLTKKVGMPIHASFIFGLPGETKKTIKDTINLARKINVNSISFSVAIPFPGTQLYDLYNREGYILTKDWNKYDTSEPVISFDGLSADYLSSIRIKAYKKYYLRMGYILRVLFSIHSISEFKDYLRIGSNLLFNKINVTDNKV